LARSLLLRWVPALICRHSMIGTIRPPTRSARTSDLAEDTGDSS
jgi:hypothetical protein